MESRQCPGVLRNDGKPAVLSKVDVERERCRNLHSLHQGKGGAVGERELLVAVPLEEAPGLRQIFRGDFEHRGKCGIEELPSETDRVAVPKTGLDQVESLYNN